MNKLNDNFKKLEGNVTMSKMQKLQEEQTIQGNKLNFTDDGKTVKSTAKQGNKLSSADDGTPVRTVPKKFSYTDGKKAIAEFTPASTSPLQLRQNVKTSNSKESINYAKIGGNSSR